ncbi:DUF2306 domain-containing protein [Bacillus sp. CGMCC 1.16607]|uniref:DUF2306 domain-containing protein n=1 Tax=Bacillus sp. CGMCC 1.16607 TaxID=3351842 RepID=UPI00363D0E8C
MKNRIFLALIITISLMWVLHNISNTFIVDPLATKILKVKNPFNTSVWFIDLRIHVISSCIALVSGAFNLSKWSFKKKKNHKINGWIYSVSVIISALSSIYLIYYATGGIMTSFSFSVSTTIWLYSLFISIVEIKNSNLIKHKEWMIRCYALTLSNITLHLVVNILSKLLNIDYIHAWTFSSWLSWTLNLLIAQIVILNIRKKQFSQMKPYSF